jgi:signal transduction histidine kinase
MKIQTKTTLLFTVLTGAFFVALAMVEYFFLDDFTHSDLYKRLELRARISAKFRFEKDEVSTEAFREIQRKYLEKLPDEKAFVFEANSKTGQFIPAPPPEIGRSYLRDIVSANGATVFKQIKFRHYAGLLYKDETGDFIVIKSAINRFGIDIMKELRYIMLVTLVCSVAIIFLIGHLFAKRTFRPFRTINNKVKQINENNLHLRLEQNDGTDEIAELTRTFNKMIDRIEMAFETQNNFISNASHELRTPLTAIIGEADFALSKERTPVEYQQSVQHIAAQAARLQHLIKGLLDLAQTGFDGKKMEWKPLRIDQLVYDVKDNAAAFIPNNRIQVSLGNLPTDESRMMMTGNYDLLKVAISNIVLNACKYSGDDKVTLQLLLEERYAKITVTDTGIGIPAADLKHIYDPFFRASNAQSYEGYGIGMPLSHNIIRLHGGKIEVHSEEGAGTTVDIFLPLK